MTEYDLEIQELRQEMQELRKENLELKRRNRNLLAKNEKLTEKLHTALSDVVKYRRQVQALMDWDME